MIEVSGLSKRYGTYLAVNNVSFSIEKGEVVGFLGPNGAGKSTIMNILTGYLSLTQGKVEIDGFDIVDYPEEAKRRIGYLPEIPPLYIDMKVREYLNFIYDLKKVKFPKKPHIDEIIRLVKLDQVQNRLIKNLSKGYRQRVGFAQALIGNPDVLILDEPTVGLDPNQIIEIRNLIAKLGKNHTIILSSHILSEIQAVCKRVIILNRGEIIADDTPENLADKLSKDRSLMIRVAGAEDDMLSALRTVEGVQRVASLGVKETGTCDFHITPREGADIREGVFRCVSAKGRALLSMTDNALSLEQVFLRLTGAADNEEARRMLGFIETPAEPATEQKEDEAE
ncbi:MAG: ATP-binding cassette domain-containing protein [Clostridia bacterium]|nr:ATP-binding cassette domain-containing protein [Clostridia bacterium]